MLLADNARANFFRPGGDHLTLLNVYNEVSVPYVYLYMYVYLYVHVYVCVHACVRVCMCACVCVWEGRGE